MKKSDLSKFYLISELRILLTQNYKTYWKEREGKLIGMFIAKSIVKFHDLKLFKTKV